ncbi:unnamed protein product [Onchocerca flexuosa]|uniref:MI domain-containing protein n=1 Tax=Onchocerca flexuosa TaxID=387005 RepID=A0A183HJD6_9BILA|nr:unnamed protein product [Onchocerca flexuosa]
MNKACTRNLPNITRDLLRENVIQERGLLARSIIQAQSYSPIFFKQVIHEILALEMILMLESPTSDSVETTVAFLKESGAKLSEILLLDLNATFDLLRSILSDSKIAKRIQFGLLQHYCKFVCSVKKNERLYGLLAERFCRLGKEFQEAFERIARDTYITIHRFDYNKLRNMACLVAHLLSTDAVSRDILDQILLNEDISSSGRMYIKII